MASMPQDQVSFNNEMRGQKKNVTKNRPNRRMQRRKCEECEEEDCKKNARRRRIRKEEEEVIGLFKRGGYE